MELLEKTLRQIQPIDNAAAQRALNRWNAIAKPLHGLGLLEDLLVQIAGIRGTAEFNLEKRAVAVFCADNGVVAEGVTQTGQEVTAVVTENLAKGETSVTNMAAVAHTDVYPIDIGVASNLKEEKIIYRKIAPGTRNMAKEPAMTREQAVAAIETGIEIAEMLFHMGYQIFATGEMGIGNTTSSSAITAVLLHKSPAEVTGRGAGLTTEGLKRKIQVIEQAIALHQPNPDDAIDTLHKVGGYDLAGLCGFFVGAAACRIPVILDGFISAAAALAAVRVSPAARDYMLASHVSGEPAAHMILKELGLKPSITAGLSLGEGTGAVALLPLLDMAYSVYRNMGTFAENHIDEYHPLI